MNTKLLLLMTAWCAAAPGTLMAQVNPVIESVKLTVPPGFCLLANHLDHAGGNTMNAVLPNVPEGSQVLKIANNNYTRDDFSIDDGGWIDAETLEPSVRTLNPGEGFFFYNPNSQDLRLTFTGAVRQGVVNVPIRNSFSVIGSPVPRPLSLTVSNGFPQIQDMQIVRYDCAEQRYKAFSFEECGPGWICLLDSDTLEPVDSTFAIPVGEGFFVYNPGAATSWTFEFRVE